jgi:hypothetical protein
MDKINSADKLREAIIQMEIKQHKARLMLKEEFMKTYESMKPVNLIKSSLKDLIASSSVKENLLKAAVTIATNYFLKSSSASSEKSPFKKMLQVVLNGILGNKNYQTSNSPD